MMTEILLEGDDEARLIKYDDYGNFIEERILTKSDIKKYNCPEDEKGGKEGEGACGGSKPDAKEEYFAQHPEVPRGKPNAEPSTGDRLTSLQEEAKRRGLSSQSEPAAMSAEKPKAERKDKGKAKGKASMVKDLTGDKRILAIQDKYLKSGKSGDSTMQDPREDSRLHEIAKLQGFDGKPQLVTDQELESYAKANNVPIMFRGVTNVDHAKGFREGEYYAGKGLTGNGTYCAYGKWAQRVASNYAAQKTQRVVQIDDPGDGVVLKMCLTKDAKIVKWEDLMKEEGALLRGGSAKERQRDIFLDEGRIATIKGYDAIQLPSKEGDSGNIIVLNRTKVMVVK